ncbi:uncharacterized protein [Clytia hemisphaerica]|uniref:uncharacterized protein n=1 Tax=Clytia hemisphaerica TaxID=252671 RepID=UPI0034D6296E
MIEKLSSMESKYENAMASINKLESNYFILKENLDGVMKSQGFLDDKYEEQNKIIAALDKELKLLIIENNKIKSTNTELTNTLKTTKIGVAKNKQNINKMEQYGRREMVDVSGIPRQRNENTDSLVIQFAGLMGLTISKRDIAISHKVSASSEAPIIVKFVSRRVRNCFFERRKNLKDYRVKDLGINGCEQKIYVNESLTSENGATFRAAKASLSKFYKFIWTHNGVTFLKEDKDSVKTFARSVTDINAILIRKPGHVTPGGENHEDNEIVFNPRSLQQNNNNNNV